MHRLINSRVVALIIAVALLSCAGVTTTARAAQALGGVVAAGSVQCHTTDPRTGQCLIDLQTPGTSTSASEGVGSTSAPSSSAAPACHSDWSDADVPCSGVFGTWSNTRDCYIQAMNPQPPADSPLREGHLDGAVYTCMPDIGIPGSQTTYMFWSATPPAGPDPAQLAQQAIAAMGLSAITVGIVPEPGPTSVGLVGLPVWMWVEQPTATTFGPTSQSASADGVTVTATARVDHVTWSMGDGDSVTCGSGTAYTDADGSSSSPTCGHTYTQTSVGQPGDSYTVTATSHWVITWAGGGATGEQTLDLTATTTIRIGETQAIITSP